MSRLQRRHSCAALGSRSDLASGVSSPDSPSGVFGQAAQSLLLQPRPSSRGSFPGADVISPASSSSRPASSSSHQQADALRQRPVLGRRASFGGVASPTMASQGEADSENAAKLLTEATLSKDSGKLFSAIATAKTAGVDRSLVDDAMKELQRLEAQSALRRSVREENLTDLENALIRAVKAHLDSAEIETARQLLKVLQAEERLQATIGLKDKVAIKWALEHATEGAREKKIEEAHEVLVRIDLTSKLKGVMYSKKTSDVRDALNAALAKGAAGPVIDEAQRILEQSEKDTQEKARRASVAAAADPAEQQVQMLAQAMLMKDPGSLKMALKLAKDAGLSKSERKAAQDLLNQLEAQQSVEKALKSKDRKKLQEALATAETAGLKGKEVEAVKKLVDESDAGIGLEKAKKSKNAGDLREAIERARSCGISGMPIDKAERVLSGLEASPKEAAGVPKQPSVAKNKSKRVSVAGASSSSAGLAEKAPEEASGSMPAAVAGY